ncbi:MAG: glycosyltransferase family 4 protein [Flavobacteriales bacterium]
MRLATFTHYAELYGANRSLLEVLLELRTTGAIEPIVIVPREGPLTARLTKEGIPFRTAPFEPWMSERYYGGRLHHHIAQWIRHTRAARKRRAASSAALEALLPELREWKPDLVHSNSLAVSIGWRAAGRLGVPHVWHAREFPEQHYGLHYDDGRIRYGKALRTSARMVAISEALKEDLLRFGVAGDKVDVVANGVFRAKTYESLAHRERRPDPAVFTFVQMGLLHPSKGQSETVRALALVREQRPEARLIIAGTGRDRDLRAAIIRTGQQDAVELPGYVEDPISLMLHCDAFVSASRWEAFGRSMVEAMACRLPVVGHASGGTTEILEEGVTGLLYKRDEGDLSTAMLKLMEDRNAARAMGEKGHVRARERYTVEASAQAFERSLEQAMQSAKAT